MHGTGGEGGGGLVKEGCGGLLKWGWGVVMLF